MALWLVVVVGLGVCSAAAENPLNMTVSVDAFDSQGLDVTISCIFNSKLATSVDLDGLSSLTISSNHAHNSTFQEMASVNSVHPEHVNLASGVNGQANALLTSSGDVSYLKVQIQALIPIDIREFQCQSTSISRFGDRFHEAKQSTGDLRGAHSISKLIQDMAEMQLKLNDANERVSQCEAITQRVVTSLGRPTLLRKQLGSNFLWVSEVFDSSFYVSLNDTDECSKVEGHLAEINNEDEFFFIRDTLRELGLPKWKYFLLTGASYDSLTSPFKFVSHPEDPVFTGHWNSNEPNRDRMDFNRLLLRFADNDLTMADGRSYGHDLVYLCEIPMGKVQKTISLQL